MRIDWFTVVAQAINFLILVWLLKRFLYQPILDAIDAREKRIASVLADADIKNAEAHQERETFQRNNDELNLQREMLLKQMTDEVEMTRQKLLDDAREAADTVSAKRHTALLREQQNLGVELSRRAQSKVFSIARKTLKDLADSSLEEAVISVFIKRLREMHGDAKQQFLVALKSSDLAQVRTAFRLSLEQQAMIQESLADTFGIVKQIHFNEASEVISGVELKIGGCQVSWSIDDYLKSLEKSIVVLGKESMKLGEKQEAENETVS